jgi:hypothetical protein
MLKDRPDQAKEVAKWLSEGEKYKSHGKVIDYAEAHDVLKLNVERIPQDSKLWNKVWELYCSSVLFLQQQGSAKLFESERVSLQMHIQVHVMPPPQQPRRTMSPSQILPPENPPRPQQPSPSRPQT